MFKRLPDTLVLVFFLLAVMTALTWIVPGGAYQRAQIAGRSDVVVAGTYTAEAAKPQNFWDLLQAPFQGFVEASKIIGFVLIVGGAFSMLMSTGAVETSLKRLIALSSTFNAGKQWLLSLLVCIFSFCGFTFGMSEESLIFILFTLPMARNMGYDAFTGAFVPFVGAAIGAATAAYNPFSVGIAMELAGIPFPSGVLLRTILWGISTLAGIAFLLVYIRKNQIQSNDHHSNDATPPLTGNHVGVLCLFMAVLIIIPIGSSQWNWGVIEIGAVFLAMGIVAATVCKVNTEKMAAAFKAGAAEMITPALVIAFARGILVIVREGSILDSILFHLSSSLEGWPPALSICGMFIVQGCVNFFIPSGSGQAAVTMPLMAPLADLLHISRDNAVLAFQLAAGYFDLIIPTSGVTMGVLSISGISYRLWLKKIWPLMVILITISLVALVFRCI